MPARSSAAQSRAASEPVGATIKTLNSSSRSLARLLGSRCKVRGPSKVFWYTCQYSFKVGKRITDSDPAAMERKLAQTPLVRSRPLLYDRNCLLHGAGRLEVAEDHHC